MPNRRDIDNARNNRLEIVKSGLTRCDLVKLGLLSSSGYFVAKNGLSAWAFDNKCGPRQCQLGCSPPVTPFIDPLPIPPILPEHPLTDPGFAQLPARRPNNAIDPNTGLPFEKRGQFNGVLRPGTGALGT